ncbi:hypothetical protein MDMS009_1795 [Methylophaga thiooxydans DMS010]|uniref:DUF3034 domain-containing protein n=1 Tax=Methylophaga thiooxydans DMS010 TaxID=637616 RepID=C0N7J9_9GAMM|nr:hypothetical protein MDMS009_1795 [Methylophaga thiooxydans DMS010]
MKTILLLAALVTTSAVNAADGKLIATPGVSQIEGAAGGGLVPWAQLAGYASRDEIAINAFCSHGNVDDFKLDVCGAQLNLYDRLELSIAEQEFDVEALDLRIRQRVLGGKIRLYGDLVYSRWPQVSLGIQYKQLDDALVANLLGAEKDSGTDYYLAASKLHLGAVGGLNWLWNVTGRYTEANQIGLLGFGSEDHDHELMLEASTALLFGRHLAVGVEYREKPDNLSLKENDWKSLFVAWVPNKYVSLTAGWLDLGEIAGIDDQDGLYFSMVGNY